MKFSSFSWSRDPITGDSVFVGITARTFDPNSCKMSGGRWVWARGISVNAAQNMELHEFNRKFKFSLLEACRDNTGMLSLKMLQELR